MCIFTRTSLGRIFRISSLPLLLLLSCAFQIITTTRASQAAGTETLVGIVGKDFILLGADSSASQSIALTASNLDKIAPLSEPFCYGGEDDSAELVKREQQKQQQQPCIVAAAAGDAAASDRLLGLLKAEATLEEYGNGLGCDVDYVGGSGGGIGSQSSPLSTLGLDVDAMANLARSKIATALRSRNPFPVCLLIAGMQKSLPEAREPFAAEQVQRQVRNAWNARHAAEERAEEDDAGSATEPATDATEGYFASSLLRPKLFWLDEYGSSQRIPYGAHGYGANFLLSILDQGFREDMPLEDAMELMKSCFQELRTRYVINSPQPPCIKCIDGNGVRLIR